MFAFVWSRCTGPLRYLRLGALPTLLSLLFATMAQAAAPGLAAAGADKTAEGVLEVVVEDHPKAARTRHFLRQDRRRIELRFKGRAPHLASGTRLRVRGQLAGDAMALSTSDPGALAVTEVAPQTVTSGELTVATLLVNFSDDRSQPFTLAQANDVVFGQTGGFIQENSFQRTWLSGNSFGWFELPIAKTCTGSAIATAAGQAAAAAGVDLSTYGRIIYVFPQNASCGWAGSANLGGSSPAIWINGILTLNVVGHEFGHTLGLYHAHSLDCGASTVTAPCTSWEYGDRIDIMASTANGHFSAFQKDRLGWLDGGAAAVQSSGRYAIEAYARAPGGLPKALKVPRGPDPTTGAMRWYYVEYRQPVGYDAELANYTDSNALKGLVVRAATDADGNSSAQLDVTPNSSSWDDWADASLVFGSAYADADAGVTIVAVSGDGISAQVDVTLSQPVSCTRAAPLLAFAPASATMAAGASTTYGVTVTNRDSSGCGSSAFDLAGQLPPGWTAGFGSTQLTVGPGASGSTTWTVTAPTNATPANYTLTASAVNAGATSFTGSAQASCAIAGAISTQVSTDRASYRAGETVGASAYVTIGTAPVANASVSFVFVKPGGGTVRKSALTDASGKAITSYKIGRKDPKGAWQLQETATSNGQTASAATPFTVQ